MIDVKQVFHGYLMIQVGATGIEEEQQGEDNP
jgi:hypothetical protein